MPNPLKHHLLALTLLSVLGGCASSSRTADTGIATLVQSSEQAEDEDKATTLLSSAFDLAEQFEGPPAELKALKLKVAAAYIRLAARYQKSGETASARTMYERSSTLESEATAKPFAETEGGRAIAALKRQMDESKSAENSALPVDEAPKPAVVDPKQSEKEIKTLSAELERKQKEPNGEIYHKVLERLAAAYVRAGKVDDAFSLFKKDADALSAKLKTDLPENKNSVDSVNLSGDLNGMATCLYSLGKFQQGELIARRMVRLEKTDTGIAGRVKGAHLALLASFQEKLGSNDAPRTRLDVASFFPAPLPQDIPIVADNLFNLGADFVATGGYQDSLDSFNKLLDFTDFAKLSPDKFATLFGLRARDDIRLHLDQKARQDEAQYLRLSTRKDAGVRANMITDWAHDYQLRDHPAPDEARTQLIQAAEMFKQKGDRDSKKNYERCIFELASIAEQQKNTAEAIHYLKLSSEGSDPRQALGELSLMAEEKGNLQEAFALSQKQAGIALKTYGADSPDYAGPRLRMVHLLLLMKRYQEGEQLAAKIVVRDVPGYDKGVCEARCQCKLLEGELYLRDGHRDKGLQYLSEAGEILAHLQLLGLSADNVNLGIQMANCYEQAKDAQDYKRVTADCLDQAIRLKLVDKQNEINDMRKNHTPH